MTRTLLLVSALALTIPATAAEKLKPVKHLIDTHIHLYDPRRDVEMSWPPESDKVLHKPHLPAEYSRVAKAAGTTGVIVVEASNHLTDNRWVLDLVKGDDFYVGLVGNVDVNRRDFGKQLRQLKKDSRFVGVRTRGPKPIDYSDPRVLANLRALAKLNLTMDYLTNKGGIPGIEKIDRVARAIPNLRIVVNHCLGYDFDGKPPGRKWIAAVKRLAENKNVTCKISGLSLRPPTRAPEHRSLPIRSRRPLAELRQKAPHLRKQLAGHQTHGQLRELPQTGRPFHQSERPGRPGTLLLEERRHRLSASAEIADGSPVNESDGISELLVPSILVERYFKCLTDS